MKSYYEEHVEDYAAALYDGGWRSTDKEEIKKRYNMNEEWAEAICEKLKEYENK